MPDTHINAFYADVEEKKQAVAQAKADLEAAEARLEEKKRTDNPVLEQPKPTTTVTQEKKPEDSDPKSNNGGVFKKKS